MDRKTLNNLFMKYLVVDAEIGGTGIRDKYNGEYVSASEIGISGELLIRLNQWLTLYENEHYNGFSNHTVIKELDSEGRSLASIIKSELPSAKLEYFSASRLIGERI